MRLLGGVPGSELVHGSILEDSSGAHLRMLDPLHRVQERDGPFVRYLWCIERLEPTPAVMVKHQAVNVIEIAFFSLSRKYYFCIFLVCSLSAILVLIESLDSGHRYGWLGPKGLPSWLLTYSWRNQSPSTSPSSTSTTGTSWHLEWGKVL